MTETWTDVEPPETWTDTPDPYQAQNDAQREQARALVHSGQNSFFPNMASASGKELVLLAHKLANLAGPMENKFGVQPNEAWDKFRSPETIASLEKEDEPAFNAPGGQFARVVTDTGATYPVGGGMESLLGKAALSPLGRTLLGKVATSTPGRSALEGAATSALTADPGQRGEAAEGGAALGGTLGFLQMLLGRGIRGTVKKSEPLQRLEGDVSRVTPDADLFVPVSQGADPEDMTSSVVSRFYKSALPYAPGVEGQLNSQANKAGQTVRRAMLQQGAPDDMTLSPNAASDVQLTTKAVRDAHDAIYNDLKEVPSIDVPESFHDDLMEKLQAEHPEVSDRELKPYVDKVERRVQHYDQTPDEEEGDYQLSGWDLKNVKDDVQGMNKDLPQRLRGLTNTTKDHIDSIFQDHADDTDDDDVADIINKYLGNKDNYQNFSPLRKAVKAASANSGDYRFGSVASRANDFTDIQGMDQDAKAVLGGKPAQTTQAGRILTYPAVAAAAHFAGVPATTGIIGGANLLATKGAQKVLYGDTGAQQYIAGLLRRYPELSNQLSAAARGAATSSLGDEF